MRSSSAEEIAARILSAGGPFSVYVHLPFCAAKCPYCSFYSMVPAGGDVEEYCRLLARETSLYGSILKEGEARAATVYFGGGTPTLLSLGQWRALLGRVRDDLPAAPDAEISVEANPDSLTEEHLAAWSDLGVTRVSVGVQSLCDGELRLLERLHDAEKARRAVAMCVEAGFSTAADLIFGLPGQTLRSFANSADGVIGLGADHLSLYQLALDEGCRWFGSSEVAADGYRFYRWAQWHLPGRGFAQYEIASFSLAGRECRHNIAYWTGGSVLALGAGAWGYAGGVRYHNERTVEGYRAAVEGRGGAVEESEELDDRGRAREAAVLLLRTSAGIGYDEFSARHGREQLSAILTALEEGVPADCFRRTNSSIALSSKGMRVANAIWRLII